jgi:hypothetical protein
LPQSSDQVRNLKLGAAKVRIHVRIQKAASGENGRSEKDDYPEVESFHQTRYERENRQLWQTDQNHRLARLLGAV